MSNFITYVNRLRQYVPNLSPQQSEDFINAAWRKICDANDEWSFLLREGYWHSPSSLMLDGLTVTANSAQVQLSHSNLPILAGQTNPPLTQRQLKVGTSGGPLYEISGTDCQSVQGDLQISLASTQLISIQGVFGPESVGLKLVITGAGANGGDLYTTISSYTSPSQVTTADPALTSVINSAGYWGSTLTLNRPYGEDSSSSATAQIYRVYYKPESTSFRRLSHIVDPIYGYWWGSLVRHVTELNRQDPRRSSQGQPYQLFFSHYNPSDGLPVYEMWPGPTMDRTFSYWYWRNCPEFVNDTDALPPGISEELLMLGARILAYEWAMTQEPDRAKRQSYATALGMMRGQYSSDGQPGRPLGLLEHAKRNDRNTYAKEFLRQPRGRMVGWPIDSNFLQSHAIPPWYG